MLERCQIKNPRACLDSGCQLTGICGRNSHLDAGLIAENEKLRATLKKVRDYIKDCDHDPAIDEIDAILGEPE